MLFVDVLPAMREAGSADDLYCAGDFIHPNARGHAAAAEAILAGLRELPDRPQAPPQDKRR